MTIKRKGLKKGTLEFLLSSAGLGDNISTDVAVAEKDESNSKAAPATIVSTSSETGNSSVSSGNTEKRNNNLLYVAIEKVIRSPFQPRKNFNPTALQELAESIKAKGLIQPLVVRRAKDKSEFELIAGERRWRASQMAGLHEVPVVVKDVDDETALVMAIVENIQREDLNPIEEAKGIQRLVDEFAMTQNQVAEVVGRSRSAVANLLRLLGLNPEVQKMLEDGNLEMGHARALLPLSEKQQLELARKIVLRNASVREVEKWVRELSCERAEKSSSGYVDDPNIKSLQMNLSDTLGAKVTINHANNGKGKLIIDYHSVDELDGIIAKIH